MRPSLFRSGAAAIFAIALLVSPSRSDASVWSVQCDGTTCVRECRSADGRLQLRETHEDEGGVPGRLLERARYRVFAEGPSVLWRVIGFEPLEAGSRIAIDSRYDVSAGTSRLARRTHFAYDALGRTVAKRERFGDDPWFPVQVTWTVRSADGEGLRIVKVRRQVGETGFVRDRVFDPETGARTWELWLDAEAAMILRASLRFEAGELATTTWYDALGDRSAYLGPEGEPLAPHPAITPVEGRAFGRFREWTDEITALIASQPVDLYFLGDSITQLWTFVEENLPVWDAFYGERWAVNGGISLDRTEYLLWRLDNGNLDSVAPKLVVLNIGVNNLGNGADPPEEVAEGVLAVLTKVGSTLPFTRILLMGVFPTGELPDTPARGAVRALNERLRGFADDERVVFLDIGEHFLDDDGTMLDVTVDFLHPNAAGYAVWASEIEAIVVDALGEAP